MRNIFTAAFFLSIFSILAMPLQGIAAQYGAGGGLFNNNVPASGGGGGDTITSPNSTISVGGTSSNTTLDLPSVSANQLLGALTATYPTGLSVPSCVASTKALNWTSGTGFTCNSAVQPTVTLTTTGTSGAATFIANTLNIPQYASSTFQQAMAAETQLNLGGL